MGSIAAAADGTAACGGAADEAGIAAVDAGCGAAGTTAAAPGVAAGISVAEASPLFA
jgi:hypothetical protein